MKFCILPPPPSVKNSVDFWWQIFFHILPRKNGLKFVSPQTSENFSTSSTARKEIYHLELALGATSRNNYRFFFLGNEECARTFFAQTFWTPPGVRDIPAKFPKHPRFLSSKPKEDELSRESTNFLTPTPSRGRPPPHRAVSRPKKLIFVLFCLAWFFRGEDKRATTNVQNGLVFFLFILFS